MSAQHHQQVHTHTKLVKVIFLDIDGVLLPFPSKDINNNQSRLFPEEQLKALSKLLAHTEAQLVLSSTWRAQPKFVQDIIDCFQDFGREYGGPLTSINKFYDTTSLQMHSERQWEIYDWIESHGYRDHRLVWLALDDEALIEGDKNVKLRHQFEGRVVCTTSSIGLTMDDVKLGMKLWDQQLQQLLLPKLS